MQGAATANEEVKGAATANEEVKPTLARPQNTEKCPRCESLNTKFCYYNNYTLSQPRYFCKSCRRYWTKGGTLRKVPIGGGRRKAKRQKPVPSSSSAAIQPSLETQNAPPSLEVESEGVFENSCYLGGGYFPSSEAIHQSAMDPRVYSFGLPEKSWAHRSFCGDDHNKKSSADCEINCCNLVQSQSSQHDRDHDHLPAYAHPP